MNIALGHQAEILFQNSGKGTVVNYKKLFQREIVFNKMIQLNRLKRNFSFLECHRVFGSNDRPEEGDCILSELITMRHQNGNTGKNLLWRYLNNKLKKKEKDEIKKIVNQEGSFGSPLDLAIWFYCEDIAIKLLELGADANNKAKLFIKEDLNGLTPLHLAYLLNMPNLVYALIKHGADQNIKFDEYIPEEFKTISESDHHRYVKKVFEILAKNVNISLHAYQEKEEIKAESNVALNLLDIGIKSKDLNVKKLFKESLLETKEIKSELDPIAGYISGLSSSWWLCCEK